MGSPEIHHRPERVLEMVAICTSDGVEIRPGGYLLSRKQLEKHDGGFLKQLQAIVRNRYQAEPQVFWEPRVRFLVEPGGEPVFRAARKQTILAGTGWPVSIQVAETDKLRLPEQELR
jgi:hypothetical protein